MRPISFLFLILCLTLHESLGYYNRPLGILRGKQNLKKVAFFSAEPVRKHTQLFGDNNGFSDSTPYEVPRAKRMAYFAGAIGLLLYALTLAPGGSPEAAAVDAQLIEKLISPTAYDGSVNALFVFLFNSFLIVPGVYGGLLLPAGKGQRFPTLAFVLASLGIGFFALGPYLGLREPRTDVTKQDVGRGTALFSNRLLAGGLLGFGLYLAYFVVQQTLSLPGGWAEQVAGFVDLFTHQRLVHVSALDMTLLSVAMADPMQEDILRRYKGENKPSALAYCLVPVLGPAFYLLTRPALPDADSN